MTNKEISMLDDLTTLYNAAQGKRLNLLDDNGNVYSCSIEFFKKEDAPFCRVYVREDLTAFHEMPLTAWKWFFPYGFKVACN